MEPFGAVAICSTVPKQINVGNEVIGLIGCNSSAIDMNLFCWLTQLQLWLLSYIYLHVQMRVHVLCVRCKLSSKKVHIHFAHIGRLKILKFKCHTLGMVSFIAVHVHVSTEYSYTYMSSGVQVLYTTPLPPSLFPTPTLLPRASAMLWLDWLILACWAISHTHLWSPVPLHSNGSVKLSASHDSPPPPPLPLPPWFTLVCVVSAERTGGNFGVTDCRVPRPNFCRVRTPGQGWGKDEGSGRVRVDWALDRGLDIKSGDRTIIYYLFVPFCSLRILSDDPVDPQRTPIGALCSHLLQQLVYGECMRKAVLCLKWAGLL